MHNPSMSADQVKQFTEEGWVMVPDVYTDADLQPVRDEITAVIDETARRVQAAWPDAASTCCCSSEHALTILQRVARKAPSPDASAVSVVMMLSCSLKSTSPAFRSCVA